MSDLGKEQALPYYDTEIDTNPALRSLVAQLIRDEAEAEMPSAMAAAAQATMPPVAEPSAIDTSRYEMTPPAIDAPEAEWRKAADLACIVLEYERMRADNAQLMQTYAESKWKQRVAAQEQAVATLERTLQHVQARVEQVNQDRRALHLDLGRRIGLADTEWTATARKNAVLRGVLAEERTKRAKTSM